MKGTETEYIDAQCQRGLKEMLGLLPDHDTSDPRYPSKRYPNRSESTMRYPASEKRVAVMQEPVIGRNCMKNVLSSMEWRTA